MGDNSQSQSLIERLAGVSSRSPLSDILRTRQKVLHMSDMACVAALSPRDCGGLSRAERAALAARIARHNGDEALAAHFLESDPDGKAVGLADPADPLPEDRRLAALAGHVDVVTVSPRSATGAAIKALKAAGIAEADIVRLSELIAFVNYQVRVISALRQLEAMQ